MKADEVKNEIRIRFIQPAQEFYNRLMEVWIISKVQSLTKEVLFYDPIKYPKKSRSCLLIILRKLSISLGTVWSERYNIILL